MFRRDLKVTIQLTSYRYRIFCPLIIGESNMKNNIECRVCNLPSTKAMNNFTRSDGIINRGLETISHKAEGIYKIALSGPVSADQHR